MKLVSLILFAVFSLSSCNYRTAKSVESFSSRPTYQSIREQILKPSCFKCHSGPEAEMGIDLDSYSDLINSSLGLVISGEPLNSTLYLNVQSGRMPPAGPRLSDTEIKNIYDWIMLGAPEK